MLLIAGLPVVFFWHVNGDSMKLERFFYSHNKQYYYALQGSVFFLLLTASIYSRLFVMEMFERFSFVKYMREVVQRGKL